MKQVNCRNCGAVFDENLEKCPYCGTMNRRGAYGSFRTAFAGMIDQMLGLRDEVNQSVSQTVVFSVLRAFLLCAAVIAIAFVASGYADVNIYSDPKRDEEAYQTIIWEDENLDRLEEAYRTDDFSTIRALWAENGNVVRRWPHYADYVLKENAQKILEAPYFTVLQLQNALYYVYFPEYYVSGNTLKHADMAQYESLREKVLKRMEEMGYSEQELKEIYEANADSYGYLDVSDLEQYVKE